MRRWLIACLLVGLMAAIRSEAEAQGQFPLWSNNGAVLVQSASPEGPLYWLGQPKVNSWQKLPLLREPTAARWSPGGKTLAYGHAGSLYLLDLDGMVNQPVALPAAGKVEGLAWSPDGRKIAVLLSTGVESLSLWVYNHQDAGSSLYFSQLPEGTGRDCRLIWSPQGRYLALLSQGGAWVTAITTEAPQPSWSNVVKDEVVVNDLLWAPDEKYLALATSSDPFGDQGEIILVDPFGTLWIPVATGNLLPVVWSQDASSLLCADLARKAAVLFTGLNQTDTPPKAQVLSGVAVQEVKGGDEKKVLVLTIPPDAEQASQTIWQALLPDKGVVRTSFHPSQWVPPAEPVAWSQPVTGSMEEVWALRADPNEVSRLLDFVVRSRASRVTLSPDGQYLAVVPAGSAPAQVEPLARLTGQLPGQQPPLSPEKKPLKPFWFRPIAWLMVMVIVLVAGIGWTLFQRRSRSKG